MGRVSQGPSSRVCVNDSLCIWSLWREEKARAVPIVAEGTLTLVSCSALGLVDSTGGEPASVHRVGTSVSPGLFLQGDSPLEPCEPVGQLLSGAKLP